MKFCTIFRPEPLQGLNRRPRGAMLNTQGIGQYKGNPMEKLWILVAESTHARLFEAKSLTKPLNEVHEFSFPEARLHERDIYSDRPGRVNDRMGEARHAMEGPDIRNQQHHDFSRQIADYLDDGRQRNAFQRLILIAPPDFLGALRDHLGHEVEKRIERTIHKNLAGADAQKIHDYIF